MSRGRAIVRSRGVGRSMSGGGIGCNGTLEGGDHAQKDEDPRNSKGVGGRFASSGVTPVRNGGSGAIVVGNGTIARNGALEG